MKKKHLFAEILSACSLAFLLAGCTSLDYVDSDYETVKTTNIQTTEMFNLRAVEKLSEEQIINAGISQTPIEEVLVLYINIQNNSDTTYKFDLKDVSVSSPIGEVAFLSPATYIEAYHSYEAQNYAGMVNAGTMLNSFATIQNQYRQTSSNTTTNIENRNQSAEFAQLESTIRGIQRHSITSYKFLNPNSSEYFYIFLKKPAEYPIVVNYKNLSYKFGGKKNASE